MSRTAAWAGEAVLRLSPGDSGDSGDGQRMSYAVTSTAGVELRQLTFDIIQADA